MPPDPPALAGLWHTIANLRAVYYFFLAFYFRFSGEPWKVIILHGCYWSALSSYYSIGDARCWFQQLKSNTMTWISLLSKAAVVSNIIFLPLLSETNSKLFKRLLNIDLLLFQSAHRQTVQSGRSFCNGILQSGDSTSLQTNKIQTKTRDKISLIYTFMLYNLK